MAKRGKARARGKLAHAIEETAHALEETAHDPKRRALAASALAAGGAMATGKLVRDRVVERGRRERARRYRLESGESLRDGIGRVARGQLDVAIGLLEESDGRDRGEAIHEARKALKRLRALLRVSRGFLGDDRYHRENAAFRDAGRALSGSRDAKVLLETLDELTKRHADELTAPPWPRLRQALKSSAEEPPDGVATASVVSRLSDARARVATWPLPQDGGPQKLVGGVARIYRRGKHALRAAEDDPSTENLHELRKRVKDLWYAAQLLRPTAPKRMRKLARRAHRVSDLLGEDHDLAVLLARAESQPRLLSPPELETLRALVGRRRELLQRDGLAEAATLYKRKPRRLARAVSSS
jgi:CHAD domain-containing protein